jgi:hypothetical protein
MALNNMQASRFARKDRFSGEADLAPRNPLHRSSARNQERVDKVFGPKVPWAMTKIALTGDCYPVKIARYTEPGTNRQMKNPWESHVAKHLSTR